MDKRSEIGEDFASNLIAIEDHTANVVEAMTYKAIAEIDYEDIADFYRR